MEWVHVAQNMGQWQSLVRKVTNFFAIKGREVTDYTSGCTNLKPELHSTELMKKVHHYTQYKILMRKTQHKTLCFHKKIKGESYDLLHM